MDSQLQELRAELHSLAESSEQRFEVLREEMSERSKVAQQARKAMEARLQELEQARASQVRYLCSCV